MKNWLLTELAIKCHLLTLVCMSLGVVIFLFGGPKDEPGTYFMIVVPLLAGLYLLSWYYAKEDGKQAKYEETLTPDQLRREQQHDRKVIRKYTLGLAFGLGAFLIGMGYATGWEPKGIPAQYLGYFMVGLASLAFLGFNTWRGGPLDKRLDEDQYDEPHRE